MLWGQQPSLGDSNLCLFIGGLPLDGAVTSGAGGLLSGAFYLETGDCCAIMAIRSHATSNISSVEGRSGSSTLLFFAGEPTLMRLTGALCRVTVDRPGDPLHQTLLRVRRTSVLAHRLHHRRALSVCSVFLTGHQKMGLMLSRFFYQRVSVLRLSLCRGLLWCQVLKGRQGTAH